MFQGLPGARAQVQYLCWGESRMKNTWNREKLLELSADFLKPRILITAAELDLFSKLKGKPQSVEDLCRENGWNPRGLRILMDALAAQELLNKTPQGMYSVDDEIASIMAGDSEETILPMVLHRNQMWRTWSNLTHIVRTGDNPNLKPPGERPREETLAFIGAMHVIAGTLADETAAAVDVTKFKRLLDLGGGSGTYTMAFLGKAPEMTATILDLPAVIELAKERLAENGFLDRVNLVPGDYTSGSLPKGHDLVLLSAIIHSNSPEMNQDLYKRIYECLEPGGAILIRDFFMDDLRTSPPEGAIFAVNMLTATRGGDSFSLTEVQEDLEQVGFQDVRLIRDGENMEQLVLATSA
jgi:hypothetical protein